MKRLLLVCGLLIALLAVPTAFAAGTTKASISLHKSTMDVVTNVETVDFSVVVDRGSTASVAVECFAPDGSVSYYQATGQFSVGAGVSTVSPWLTLYGVTVGSTCNAWVYKFVPKQMIAASTSFVA